MNKDLYTLKKQFAKLAAEAFINQYIIEEEKVSGNPVIIYNQESEELFIGTSVLAYPDYCRIVTTIHEEDYGEIPSGFSLDELRDSLEELIFDTTDILDIATIVFNLDDEYSEDDDE